jgi:hypothetical protein
MDLIDGSRICDYCGKRYYKKEKEHVTAFAKRKYCSYKCMYDGQKKNKHWREYHSGTDKAL